MLDFVSTEVGNIRCQFRVIVTEFVELATVMTVDFSLDSVSAGKRCLLGHERRRGAEREAGDVPKRLKRSRANAAFRDQLVESSQVPLLLRCHA